jgi:hypothetical protein
VKHSAIALLALGAFASGAGAQPGLQRRASLAGNGTNQSGKCTIEVVVDGAAEVEVRGDTGQIRNVSGQPPQWRRFECTGPLPANPVDFRFSGVDGRGRQQLVADPRNGGAAVVRIEDTSGGPEGYTFDLTWGQGNGYLNDPRNAGDPRNNYPAAQNYPGAQNPGYPNNRQFRWGGRVVDRQYAVNQAINVCRDAARQQAMDRYRPGRVEFRNMRLDDNPGRNDWVLGMIDVYQRGGREDHYEFSCSVNFDTGRVRSVDLDLASSRRNNGRSGDSDHLSPTSRAIEGCQVAVVDRMRRDGYSNVDVRSIRMDEGRGRNDFVIGDGLAQRGRGSDPFRFSCTVDPRDGDVRTVDVNRR